MGLVVLLCKQIGIQTPLILVMVLVMKRLISYMEQVNKIESYKYNSVWGEGGKGKRQSNVSA